MKTRVIKFRVWNSKDQKYWNGADLDEINLINGTIDLSDNFKTQCDGNLSLEQFTGLKDKNGKEIYEGDVIKIKDHSNEIVSFKYGAFVTSGGVNIYNMMLEDEGGSFETNVLEVIGNIHQNKKSLK